MVRPVRHRGTGRVRQLARVFTDVDGREIPDPDPMNLCRTGPKTWYGPSSAGVIVTSGISGYLLQRTTGHVAGGAPCVSTHRAHALRREGEKVITGSR